MKVCATRNGSSILGGWRLDPVTRVSVEKEWGTGPDHGEIGATLKLHNALLTWKSSRLSVLVGSWAVVISAVAFVLPLCHPAVHGWI